MIANPPSLQWGRRRAIKKLTALSRVWAPHTHERQKRPWLQLSQANGLGRKIEWYPSFGNLPLGFFIQLRPWFASWPRTQGPGEHLGLRELRG